VYPDDHGLMLIRADALFTYDTSGRMLCTNEPLVDARRPAPRLFLGGTRVGRVLRVGADVPHELARRLAKRIDLRAPLADLRAPVASDVALRAELEAHRPIAAEESGPSYRFPASIAVADQAVRLAHDNRELVRATYPWLYEELASWQPCFAAVREGEAVSVCFTARLSADAAEAGVDTLAAFRHRGHAGTVTLAWGAAIRASGRIPLYSTAWDNAASQAVARRIGLIMFGADSTWT